MHCFSGFSASTIVMSTYHHFSAVAGAAFGRCVGVDGMSEITDSNPDD